MYNRIIVFCFFYLMSSYNIYAQHEVFIKGIIQDQKTSSFIEGAYVSVNNQKANAISNREGEFLLKVDYLGAADSLVVEALGYKKIIVSFSNIDPTFKILLTPTENILPEVVVGSYHVNWANFVAKYQQNFKAAKKPFEAELQKTITVVKNGDSAKKISLHAFSHYEGLTDKAFTSSLRGLNFWFAVDQFTVGDTAEFVAYSTSGKPQAFTELELGKFQWLIVTDTTGVSKGEAIAKYEIESITQFGEDSVYVVKHTPKSQEENKRVRFLNQTSGNELYSFFSAEKKFYIRKKDFKLIRIDFYQRRDIPEQQVKINIARLDYITGTIGFFYTDETVHPAFIHQKMAYVDGNGNSIERIDNTYFSNIRLLMLSDTELKKKYQLNKIFRSYPVRDVSFNNYQKIGAFWYVPVIKK